MTLRIFTTMMLFLTITASAQLTSIGGVAQSMADPGGGDPLAYNAIKFDYDAAGNQIKRYYIYLPAGQARIANQQNLSAKATQKLDYFQSEQYNDISYYPNPVQSELNVNWKYTKAVDRISINSSNGALLRTIANQENNSEAKIDFSEYPSGAYFLILYFKNGEAKTLNIIKR